MTAPDPPILNSCVLFRKGVYHLETYEMFDGVEPIPTDKYIRVVLLDIPTEPWSAWFRRIIKRQGDPPSPLAILHERDKKERDKGKEEKWIRASIPESAIAANYGPREISFLCAWCDEEEDQLLPTYQKVGTKPSHIFGKAVYRWYYINY